MKERPIIFTGESVNAIQQGYKTMTRRVIKHQPFLESCPNGYESLVPGEYWFWETPTKTQGPNRWGGYAKIIDLKRVLVEGCPYGQPGDRLWVRETWRDVGDAGSQNGCLYRADSSAEECETIRPWIHWRPSIFMPRLASRILLEIVSVRVERVQDIGNKDALREGIEALQGFPNLEEARASFLRTGKIQYGSPERFMFAYLWDSINAKRGFDWIKNPLVWVIKYKRIA